MYNFLFLNICMCLIHVNRSTPSLLYLITVETYNGTNDQLMLRFYGSPDVAILSQKNMSSVKKIINAMLSNFYSCQ